MHTASVSMSVSDVPSDSIGYCTIFSEGFLLEGKSDTESKSVCSVCIDGKGIP